MQKGRAKEIRVDRIDVCTQWHAVANFFKSTVLLAKMGYDPNHAPFGGDLPYY